MRLGRLKAPVLAALFAIISLHIPVARAAEISIFDNSAEQKMDSEGTALTLANSSSSDADEYKIEFTLSVTRSTENSNSLSLTRHEDESRSYLGRLVRRCMAGIEDIHLLRRIGFHTSHRSFQSSGLMAGYGQLFKDDATLTTSCDNGTRQEEPGFVYLCSNFQF